MNMSGERLIAAPRADVWAALNDPDVLKACIPGCQELSKDSETSFSAIVVQKVGPVKATFKGAVELTDIVEGESYHIQGEGKGGAAGFAKGGAKVRLADAEAPEGAAGPATLLTYEAEAKVGGKLAQLGSRLIDGFARKMADDFFDRFSRAVAAPAGAEASAAEAAPVPADAPIEEKKKSWLGRLMG